MAFELLPGPYRYSLKKGMTGTDVAALQLNLAGLTVDGNFGTATRKAVSIWQGRHNLFVDGIAGPDTQKSLCVVLSTAAARLQNLPVGLAKSIMAHESGFFIAAYAKHPSDWGFDLGPYQRSFGPEGDPATQVAFTYAYSIKPMAAEVCSVQRAKHDHFMQGTWVENASEYGEALKPKADYDSSTYAWQLAILNHNWPGAAENLAVIGRIFFEDGRDDEPQDWIIEASGGSLHTPREWVMFYIPSASVYVKW